jgi:hypothetical protein
MQPTDERNRLAILDQLNFMLDQIKRVASTRAGVAGGNFSGQVNESRKLQKTATEVQTESNTQGVVSSASVDRFNDPDRELFRQLWAEMGRMKTRLPIVDNGQFVGFIDEAIYELEFLIIPAASQKTLNPDAQFQKASVILGSVVETAPVTGADLAAGYKYIIGQADPILGAALFPDPESGETPITTTLNALTQQIEQLTAADEQIAADVEENSVQIDQVAKLATESLDV